MADLNPDFSKTDGLIPAIVQDYKTGEILMLAYMNEAAWKKTLETKKATFYSRSRNKLWMKGEESGNVQEVKEIAIDCDLDSILLKVNQIGGAACHTGFKSCFYRKLEGDKFVTLGKRVFNPEEKYGNTKKN
jgi:phosphoribosyl-AMP cyclohydrolase